MGTRRSCLGVAVLHGLLYAAGGYDGASCLNRYLWTDTMTIKEMLSYFVKMSLLEVSFVQKRFVQQTQANLHASQIKILDNHLQDCLLSNNWSIKILQMLVI